MTYRPFIDHNGHPMITHGDIADGLRAAADSLKQWDGDPYKIGHALDAMADVFVKKHEFLMREVWRHQEPWSIEGVVRNDES